MRATAREREVLMVLQLRALREAFIDAGSDPAKAQKASAEVDGYEHRLASLDAKLALLTWMVSFNLILTVSVLWRLLSH